MRVYAKRDRGLYKPVESTLWLDMPYAEHLECLPLGAWKLSPKCG